MTEQKRLTPEERQVIRLAHTSYLPNKTPLLDPNTEKLLDSERVGWDEVERLLAALEETKRRNTELHDDLTEASNEAMRYEEEARTWEDRHSELYRSYTDQDRQLAEAHAEIERLNTELLETKEARTVAENQSKRHKSEASAWEEAHDDLHQVSIKQAESLAEAQQELVSQTNKLTQAEQTIANLSKIVSDHANVECSLEMATRTDLLRMYINSQQTIARLESELEEMTADRNIWRSNSTDWDGQEELEEEEGEQP